MKLLFDFFPIILFFVGYKIYGIYAATAIAMIASVLQVAYIWVRHHKVESLHIITLVLVIILGSATLLLHNAMFIKWKPTAIYWTFAITFFVSHFIGKKKPLIQRLMESKLVLSHSVWKKLNWSWIGFFIFMGIANLFVVYHFSTDAWVNFKLFGTLTLTIIFVLLQAMYMAKHTSTNTNKVKNKMSEP